MATFRVGVGSFNLKDGAIGIGTETSGHGELKVEGTIKSDQLEVIGVSTFIRYSGFSANEISIGSSASQFVAQNTRNLTLPKEYQSTGDIIVEDGSSLTVGLGSTTCLGSLEYVCVKHHFSVPTGDTSNRNRAAGYVEGTIRYNTDLGTMEFFNGNEWRQFTYITDVQNSPSSRGRGVIGGGHSYVSTIQYWEIATLGDALNFGDLTNARAYIAGNVASEVRGIFGGGRNPAVHTNRIDYISIASSGNAVDFGDQSRAYMASGGMSSSTRGIFAGGYAPSLPDLDMEYIEIATTGNALDFGDLFTGAYYSGSVSSPVRGLYAGGNNPSGAVATIQQLTIASLGNTVRFGDLTVSRFGCAGGGNSIRGIFCGGYAPYAPSGKKLRQDMDYVTIASDGNAITFGDALPSATTGINQRSGSGSNQTRAVWAGGLDNVTSVNVMEYVTVATTGNSQDFGDLPEKQRAAATLSDSHGGLGGY